MSKPSGNNSILFYLGVPAICLLLQSFSYAESMNEMPCSDFSSMKHFSLPQQSVFRFSSPKEQYKNESDNVSDSALPASDITDPAVLEAPAPEESEPPVADVEISAGEPCGEGTSVIGSDGIINTAVSAKEPEHGYAPVPDVAVAQPQYHEDISVATVEAFVKVPEASLPTVGDFVTRPAFLPTETQLDTHKIALNQAVSDIRKATDVSNIYDAAAYLNNLAEIERGSGTLSPSFTEAVSLKESTSWDIYALMDSLHFRWDILWLSLSLSISLFLWAFGTLGAIPNAGLIVQTRRINWERRAIQKKLSPIQKLA
jgi:hypothetical protein